MTLELAEVVGRLVGLHRFPVEPVGGESLDTGLLSPGGLVGDRVFEIRDAESGEPLAPAAFPRLLFYSARYLEELVVAELDIWGRLRTPEGLEYAIGDPQWLAEMSRIVGRPLLLSRRVQQDRPLRLISRQTLRLTERTYGTSLEPRRLRANLIIEIHGGNAFDENRWIGQRLRIGEALLEVTEAGGTCVETSLGPETSAGDAHSLEELAKLRGGSLGVAAHACEGSRLRSGDPVVLVD